MVKLQDNAWHNHILADTDEPFNIKKQKLVKSWLNVENNSKTQERGESHKSKSLNNQ